ncbi:MAG: LuxR C-terminal-related transcriptional regulator [Anaerolineae bacterium]
MRACARNPAQRRAIGVQPTHRSGNARPLGLVAEGKTNREIAQSLFLGEGTVRNFVSSILSKLMTNRAEAAAYAVQHNIQAYLTEE